MKCDSICLNGYCPEELGICDHQSEEEVWVAVEGFEDYYEVSSHGRVRSIEREIQSVDGKVYRLKGSIIKPVRHKSRLCYECSLSMEGKRTQCQIARLVWRAFVDDNPPGKIRHLDEDRSNNRPENLRPYHGQA
ncbi:MAG TPA: NUMOD4 domain-containing protein [Methanosarcina sp.]|nr:NUMOD4 domain-containing protein [Methanosarcina sp.]